MIAPTITPTQEQRDLLDDIHKWLRGKGPVYQVRGPAGTAKSTVAAWVVNKYQNARGLTFQAKAASVLRGKGAHQVSTIHSYLYGPPVSVEELDGRQRLNFKMKKAHEPFRLAVVDEASQIDAKLGRDLLEKFPKVITFGDRQLPPVDGSAPFFSDGRFPVDFRLQEIHRQALNSPVLRLATDIRLGKPLPPRDQYDRRTLGDADIIICATNPTRRSENYYERRERFGGRAANHRHPLVGERVICMRNDHANKVYNGTIWEVTKVTPNGDHFVLELFDEFDGERRVVVPLSCFIEDINPAQAWTVPQAVTAMTFAYCITCHKAQGSEWDRVTVLDETDPQLMRFFAAGGMSNREYRALWRYVAVSRAKAKVSFIEFGGPR